MAWDFTTEPEFQEKLDWANSFVRDEIEPLDVLFGDLTYQRIAEPLKTIIDQLKAEVRARDLWAAHLDPDLGGKGYGQLKLALLNEILGRSPWAPTVFGTQAPDTGNAEIIAAYGTPEQKERWLQPLLNGEVFSCYSMTEPQGGSDPTLFTTRAIRDGDEWVINGEKFFSSNLREASFLIVMAVTDPDVSPYRGMSMFLIPSDTAGLQVLCNIGLAGEGFGEGMHAHVRYSNVRVPVENLLGGEGEGFAVAQRRLGGGRIHHAMRSVAGAQKAFDMMCERALSRFTQGSLLAEKQMVQEMIAESWIQIQEFRLLVLYTAWQIDQSSTAAVRQYVSACKVRAAEVLHDVGTRTQHIYGALGVSNLMSQSNLGAATMGLVDGVSEVHKITIARRVLKSYRPSPDMWPSQFKPRVIVNARRRFDTMLEERVPDIDTRHDFARLLEDSPGRNEAIKVMVDYMDSTTGNL